jgi:hypothetical protein
MVCGVNVIGRRRQKKDEVLRLVMIPRTSIAPRPALAGLSLAGNKDHNKNNDMNDFTKMSIPTRKYTIWDRTRRAKWAKRCFPVENPYIFCESENLHLISHALS